MTRHHQEATLKEAQHLASRTADPFPVPLADLVLAKRIEALQQREWAAKRRETELDAREARLTESWHALWFLGAVVLLCALVVISQANAALQGVLR